MHSDILDLIGKGKLYQLLKNVFVYTQTFKWKEVEIHGLVSAHLTTVKT